MRCAQSCAERFSALNRKGPYFVLSLLLLLFCVLCGVIFKSVLKSIFSIIRLLDLEKKTQTRQYSSCENYYTSARSTELKF